MHNTEKLKGYDEDKKYSADSFKKGLEYVIRNYILGSNKTSFEFWCDINKRKINYFINGNKDK